MQQVKAMGDVRKAHIPLDAGHDADAGWGGYRPAQRRKGVPTGTSPDGSEDDDTYGQEAGGVRHTAGPPPRHGQRVMGAYFGAEQQQQPRPRQRFAGAPPPEEVDEGDRAAQHRSSSASDRDMYEPVEFAGASGGQFRQQRYKGDGGMAEPWASSSGARLSAEEPPAFPRASSGRIFGTPPPDEEEEEEEYKEEEEEQTASPSPHRAPPPRLPPPAAKQQRGRKRGAAEPPLDLYGHAPKALKGEGHGQHVPSSALPPAVAAASAPPQPPAMPVAAVRPGAAVAAPERFNTFTVVWAKFGSFPWWPAQIQEAIEPKHKRLKHGKHDYFVVWYGEGTFGWVPPKHVEEFTMDYAKRARSKSAGLQEAINDAWAAIGRPRPDV